MGRNNVGGMTIENQQLVFLARQSTESRSVKPGSNKVTFLISGQETGGTFSLTEFEAAPPPAPPAPVRILHDWELMNDFVYSQVIKHQRRRKTVKVERRVLVGEASAYAERLRQAGLSGRINTSFVERLNLTIRQYVSKLTRRTWGPAKHTPELMEHLEWWRMDYHFVRPHESVVEELGQPVKRKGKQQLRKYRKRTPAMLAGLRIDAGR